MLARPILRLATGIWPRRQELTSFRAAFAEGHHHLPRLFFALSQTTNARFYLIDTMLAACRNIAATPREAASHAQFAGPPLALLHIEKTAGSSVIGFLERRYALVQIAPRTDSAAAANALLQDPATRHYAVLHGHYDLPELRRHAPERGVIAFLRDPAARILSAYYYWRSRQLATEGEDVNQAAVLAARLNLPEFLRCDEPLVRNQIDNVYTRRLAGLYVEGARDPLADDPIEALGQALAALDGLIFVGTTERLADSLNLLCRRLGLVPPSAVPRINVGLENEAHLPGDFTPVPREPMTPEIEAELERLTRLDRILYATAVRLMTGDLGGAARSLLPT